MLTALALRGERTGTVTATAPPATRAAEVRDVRSVYVPGPYRLKPLAPSRGDKVKPLVDAPWERLIADTSGNVVMKATVGRGTIYAVSEADIFGNGDIRQQDNVVLAANLLFAGDHDQAYFNERLHLHETPNDNTKSLPLGRMTQAMWLAFAALAIYLIGVGKRFGRPVPVRERPRRSALEYVEALADLYRRAEARTAIWGLLRQSFRRRLSTLVGVSAELPADRLAAAVARRSKLAAPAVQHALDRLEAMPTYPSDEELLDVAQQLAAIEEAVKHEH